MTTLGSTLKTAPKPLDVGSLVASIAPTDQGFLGDPRSITASLIAWTSQDDDAHEMCSLVACRTPLHPGPCKGWKHTLHSVSPAAWHQVEAKRVEKANGRRLKRIADLKAQGKPIPRTLLDEIKPKPAPTGAHPAHGVAAVPLGQVGQKADLAGGQAHHAGQAVSNAAGVTTKVAPPLPTGPKGKKPSVAGRGPAFVITQPKVTDQYKIDKAGKLTPADWAALTPGDKKAIRDELEAIKVRGFGPQQKKANELLAKLPAASTLGSPAHNSPIGVGAKPANLGPLRPPAAPGSIANVATQAGQAKAAANGKVAQALQQSLANPKISTLGTPGKTTLGKAAKAAPTSPALKAAQDKVDAAKAAVAAHQAKPKLTHTFTPKAAKAKLADQAKNTPAPTGVDHNIASLKDNYAKTGGGWQPLESIAKGLDKQEVDQAVRKLMKDPDFRADPHALSSRETAWDKANAPVIGGEARHMVMWQKATTSAPGGSGKPSTKAPSAPAAPPAPAPSAGNAPLKAPAGIGVGAKKADLGPLKPAAPLAPGTPAHVQHAAAVANRTAPKAQMSKTQTDAYDKLSKADFDKLPDGTQKQIRDDLANAKTKFLDPKKQQATADLLNRFGSRHPAAAPAAPGNAKGYSDPMNEVVKATSSGLVSTDDVLKSVARLTPGQVGKLDDADRKRVLGRLALIATHPSAPQEQKDRAAAYGRIINGRTHVPASQKFDHAPSVGELHREEQKGGHAAAADALANALVAAHDTAMPRDARVKALNALTKPQFDALNPHGQRTIIDALHSLHVTRGSAGGPSVRDDDVAAIVEKYTGLPPGAHRMRQAEADFRAGKITDKQLHTEFLHARVATATKPGDELSKEAERIARDNPSLPLWLRATLIDNPYSAPRAYKAIAMASGSYNWADAPRLSGMDMREIFAATDADLASVDPIHREAVKGLREHVLTTGLRGDPGTPTGSPWSTSTRDEAVNAALGLDYKATSVDPDRLKEFQALPKPTQDLIRQTLAKRILNTRNNSVKVAAHLIQRDLDGAAPYSKFEHAALVAATVPYPAGEQLNAYYDLDPMDFRKFPDFAQSAIKDHLTELQNRAEAGIGHTWTPQDDALKVLPAALAARLEGGRANYTSKDQRDAADVARFGTKAVTPGSRVDVYAKLSPAKFDDLSTVATTAIEADLEKISHDGGNPLLTRYNAQFTNDVHLQVPARNGSPLSPVQVSAIERVDPHPNAPYADVDVAVALGKLDKAGYDGLDKTFRDAIDARVKQLPGASGGLLAAKFHPAAAPATPGGYAPTVQASVPPHVQTALDTIYGVHPKAHTMAHQLSAYGALRGHDFAQFNAQEQGHLLGDLSFIATTAKGPSGDKARKLIDRFSPPGTPAGQVPAGVPVPPANAVAGQTRFATPLVGTLVQAKDPGLGGDGWTRTPGGKSVWGKYGAAGLLLMHQDPGTGEKRYLMVQRGPAISDPGKWQFPGGAIDSKETPHQGGTREVIEELGFKADALAAAQVHGEHVSSIPGSSWKYTSIAAQVPQMLKPDLSTHHARAETSDAKWMTEAEIRKLDTDGKLLAPLAGGKLEQNVLSLFPAALTKLGQVSRPGPITKRLGRLPVPAGGRQAPATFNAWPHPHKPSTGKNLVADKAAIDAQRQKIKQDRALYDAKTADGRLAAIGAQQGFDALPTVMDRKDIDRLLATGDYIEAWRGVSGGGGWSARSRGGAGGKTAAQINEEMRSGPAYYGKGIFGNGYYLATKKSVAQQYSDGTHGSVVRMLIPKTALTDKYDKVEKEAQSNSSRTSKAKGAGGYELSTFWDPGRWGAAKGLDGIEINPHHRAHGGGGASHVASTGKPAYNWLNRAVLIIQKEPG